MRGVVGIGMLLLACPACTGPADDTGKGHQDHTGHDSADSGDSGDTGAPLPVDVYLLAGGTNMDGAGYATALPPSLQSPQTDVWLYQDGALVPLGAASTAVDPTGHGCFGPEVTFGRTMADAVPDRRAVVVKVTSPDASLGDGWAPGEYAGDPRAGAAYTEWLTQMRAVGSLLTSEGRDWRYAGFAWMQGEVDGADAELAADYGAHLTALIRRVREDTGTADLPVAIGSLHCPSCTWREIVRLAESEVAAADPTVVLFDTEDLPVFTDAVHYDGSGVRTLGQRFASSLRGTRTTVTARPAFQLGGPAESLHDGTLVVGYTFTLDRSITVTDLGTLDEGFDGLTAASDVGLWTAAGGRIARATVPASTDAATANWGGWRFVGVEPTNLDAGTYVLGATVTEGSPDGYLHGVPLVSGSGFAWAEGRQAASPTLRFPGDRYPEAGSWFGPNLMYLPR